jgi:hypothetical protein
MQFNDNFNEKFYKLISNKKLVLLIPGVIITVVAVALLIMATLPRDARGSDKPALALADSKEAMVSELVESKEYLASLEGEIDENIHVLTQDNYVMDSETVLWQYESLEQRLSELLKETATFLETSTNASEETVTLLTEVSKELETIREELLESRENYEKMLERILSNSESLEKISEELEKNLTILKSDIESVKNKLLKTLANIQAYLEKMNQENQEGYEELKGDHEELKAGQAKLKEGQTGLKEGQAAEIALINRISNELTYLVNDIAGDIIKSLSQESSKLQAILESNVSQLTERLVLLKKQVATSQTDLQELLKALESAGNANQETIDNSFIYVKNELANIRLLFNQTQEELLVELTMDIDGKFAALNSKVDTKFGELNNKVDTKFGDLSGKVDTKFADLNGKVDTKFGDLNTEMAQLFQSASNGKKSVASTIAGTPLGQFTFYPGATTATAATINGYSTVGQISRITWFNINENIKSLYLKGWHDGLNAVNIEKEYHYHKDGAGNQPNADIIYLAQPVSGVSAQGSPVGVYGECFKTARYHAHSGSVASQTGCYVGSSYTSHSHSGSASAVGGCYGYTAHTHTGTAGVVGGCYGYTAHEHIGSGNTGCYRYQSHTHTSTCTKEDKFYSSYCSSCNQAFESASSSCPICGRGDSNWNLAVWKEEYTCGNSPKNSNSKPTACDNSLNANIAEKCNNSPKNSGIALTCNNQPLNSGGSARCGMTTSTIIGYSVNCGRRNGEMVSAKIVFPPSQS